MIAIARWAGQLSSLTLKCQQMKLVINFFKRQYEAPVIGNQYRCGFDFPYGPGKDLDVFINAIQNLATIPQHQVKRQNFSIVLICQHYEKFDLPIAWPDRCGDLACLLRIQEIWRRRVAIVRRWWTVSCIIRSQRKQYRNQRRCLIFVGTIWLAKRFIEKASAIGVKWGM